MAVNKGHTVVGYVFPNIPSRWGPEERAFAQALNRLFDELYNRTKVPMTQEERDKLAKVEAGATKGPFYAEASQEAAGLMSAEDKLKLDSFDLATQWDDGWMSAEDKLKLDSLDLATQEAAGLMNAEDKTNLDKLMEKAIEQGWFPEEEEGE